MRNNSVSFAPFPTIASCLQPFPQHHLSKNSPFHRNRTSSLLSFLGSEFDMRAIQGCSNGLLLCRRFSFTPFESETYYVCNPLTKDRIQLPPSLRIRKRRLKSVGFIYDPYYCIEAETGRVTLSSCHPNSRFRVVLLPYFEGRRFAFKVQVFSSETKQWRKLVVSCPNGFACGYIRWPAVAYHGKLHFVGLNNILVYDPYNNDEPCHTLDLPVGAISSEDIFGCLGVSCGNLRMSQTHALRPVLSVWELNGSSGDWHLVKRINLPRKVASKKWVDAYHPHDGDIVLLNSHLGILSLNLHTQKIEQTGYDNKDTLLSNFSLELPLWPPSIPSIE